MSQQTAVHCPEPASQDTDDLVPLADSLLLRWVELAHSMDMLELHSPEHAGLIRETLEYLVEQEDRRAGE